ncbi:hypothetical protein E3N88_23737 [Mikania micrantha]|uniref:Uncharacterized protein n=1 Tax=Mikania micrantha TaxID=192012 RepID=A0A5N6NE39_9ASTR|nr:hypothetical protein E3N88_23737 [Mikania micrantha]
MPLTTTWRGAMRLGQPPRKKSSSSHPIFHFEASGSSGSHQGSLIQVRIVLLSTKLCLERNLSCEIINNINYLITIKAMSLTLDVQDSIRYHCEVRKEGKEEKLAECAKAQSLVLHKPVDFGRRQRLKFYVLYEVYLCYDDMYVMHMNYVMFYKVLRLLTLVNSEC